MLPSKHGKQASRAFLERVRRVKEDPACADHWWNLLASEEDGGHEPQGLYKLYEWATKLVPRKGNKNSESYVGLWLGYIKRQRNEEDVRDTFKTLRNMGIGETSPSLYPAFGPNPSRSCTGAAAAQAATMASARGAA